MKTTNKLEILKPFENDEYAKPSFPEALTENDQILMRSEISKIYPFNQVYKDNGKWYLENSVDAVFRLAKRCKVEIDNYTYEDLEHSIYRERYC